MSALERMYMLLGVMTIYFLDVGEAVSVSAGFLACFFFFPAYAYLNAGVGMVSFALILGRCALFAVCILTAAMYLDESSSSEMSILFLVSYLAAKGYRFLMVRIFNKGVTK
ncbi:hypothetical protein IB232_16620 [Pseudomonas sp. PDM15]|uniref:hypothetical protein n=1 Tax=Pseudomonas sp. PDM15 TaxID=2769303 RepID=UPI0017854405|nr:hypothetical protein [Pseudomonas sp. PDM15]MBD9426960.1 hypothetical protein [Pseudomonas sp. PDM15]